jgi:hypothetical protein
MSPVPAHLESFEDDAHGGEHYHGPCYRRKFQLQNGNGLPWLGPQSNGLPAGRSRADRTSFI